MALVLLVATAMAKEPRIITDGSTKNLVFMLDSTSEETSIQLVDSDGNIIYTEAVPKRAAYAKRFDLNHLESGSYSLKVGDPIKEIAFTIVLNEEHVRVVNRVEHTKPLFREKDGKVLLNLLNLDLNPVELSVYDSSNRILFSEGIEGEQTIRKSFNFENALTDHYTVMVKDGENTYYEEIVVE